MALLYLKNFIAPRPRPAYYPLPFAADYDAEQSPITLAGIGHDREHGQSHPCQASVSSSDDSESFSETEILDLTNAAAAHAVVGPSAFDARLLSAATIGFSDGLTVPFALTAGLSALGTSKVVIYGGLSELIAGTISMGMGGYLGAKGEAAAYAATLSQTQLLVQHTPHLAAPLVARTLLAFNLPQSLLHSLLAHLLSSPALTVSFLMNHHHHLPPASFPASRPFINGAVVSSGYIVGGIVPLLPYVFVRGNVQNAFHYSIAFTAIVLFLFGYLKTKLVGEKGLGKCLRGGVEMLLLGGLAAGAAVGCVKSLR